jgi:nucleotide-binding universal stress UspA family protein
MKTILVPTDFSECAEHALHYACYIAEKVNARIILLHVLASAQPDVSFSEEEWMGRGWAGESTDVAVPAMMQLLKSTKKKMSRLMNLPKSKNIYMVDFIEIGNVGATINRAVKKHKADLIVMGTHGTSGLNEIFIGSNAEHIVRDAEVPVLSVKEGAEKPEIKKIVFATDFSEETELIFNSIKNFAEIFNAEVHMVKILTAPSLRKREQINIMFEQLTKEIYYPNISSHIYYHDVREIGIRNFSETIHANLIALGTHGRHGLARFFRGSIAEGLVNHASFPVLTINFHKKQLEEINKGKKFNPEEQIAENIIPETFYSGHIPSI